MYMRNTKNKNLKKIDTGMLHVTEGGAYNVVQKQWFIYKKKKSWCEWKEITTWWQQNTWQKERPGTPFHDQLREFWGKGIITFNHYL